MNGINLHPHQQLSAIAYLRYDTIIEIGGVGSGKSLGDAVILLQRSTWDTAQWHLLCANTWPQIQAVTGEIYKWFELAGEEHVFNRRPPSHWVDEWRAKGIKTPPPRDRYTNAMIMRNGLHVYQAALLNQGYTQLRGWEFGCMIGEEFTAGPPQVAIEFAMERVRCGIGPEMCRELHRHTKYLKGNPPEDDGHWVYDWLALMDGNAAKLVGGEPSKHSESYPNLLRGVGPVLYIPSRTRDNIKHLGDGYIDNQLARLDEETAKKRLDGVLSRRRQGRTYNKFTNENEKPVGYFPDRTVYLYFDFNFNPAVAGAAHPLFPGNNEYPDQGPAAANLKHVGIFGEFFHVGGMDADQLARALVKNVKSGDKPGGSDGYFPSNWNGLAAHPGKIIVFGDATAGAKRSMTGTNPWKIIKDVLGSELRGRVTFNVPDHNPQEIIRVRSVNAKFESAAGFRTLFIDPHCDKHIHDFEAVQNGTDGVVMKPGGPRAGSKLWLLTHLSDAVGYWIASMFPMGKEVSAKPEDYIPRTGPATRTPPRTSI